MVSLTENNHMINFSFFLSRDLRPSFHHSSATPAVYITLTLLFVAILSIMWWKRNYLKEKWKGMFQSSPTGWSSNELVDQISILLCFNYGTKISQ